MLEKPEIVQSTEQLVACVHVVVAREQIREVMGPGLQEVMAAIAAQGQVAAGPWLTHHLKDPGASFDFEICVPIHRAIAASGRVRTGTLPAARVARTVYVGPYEGMGTAWGEFRAWIEAEGHRRAEGLWERYLVGPESGPDGSAYRTELNQPLAAS
jgi:effector-binding domain-containing protein